MCISFENVVNLQEKSLSIEFPSISVTSDSIVTVYVVPGSNFDVLNRGFWIFSLSALVKRGFRFSTENPLVTLNGYPKLDQFFGKSVFGNAPCFLG